MPRKESTKEQTAAELQRQGWVVVEVHGDSILLADAFGPECLVSVEVHDDRMRFEHAYHKPHVQATMSEWDTVPQPGTIEVLLRRFADVF